MNNKTLTLGSLFSGSGGFELGGVLAGISPVWNCEIEKFPIRVTTKRFPGVKHYGDIKELDGGEIPPVDIITFGSPCFPAGTLVLTDKGLVEIENIHVGDRVLTHKGRWRRVTAVGAKEAPTILLKGNHCGLECTSNHPIYSHDRDICSWVPAKDMLGKPWCVPTAVEYLLPPKPVFYEDKRVKPLPEFSEGFFYFIGRWLGDGWVRDSQRSGRPKGQTYSAICLCDSGDKLDELISTVRCVSDRYSIEHGDTCVKVKCNGRALCDFLTSNFGRCAHGKEIPAWVLSLPEKYRRALLQGIFDSDGYWKPKFCRVTTTSKKLALGIRLLAESLGKETTVYYSKRPAEYTIQGRKVKQRCSYTTEVQDRNTHHEDGLHRWYKVKSITQAAEKTTVYNMTVEEDNSYTADGIVVHNCQDMSIAGKREGLDGSRSGLFHEAVRVIKEMRCKTNDRYPRYIVWENVPGAFSSNKGEDFRSVLKEICGIKDGQVHVPEAGKWEHAGCILGEGYSVAWRLFDSQYWGVPQRRKRIYLVADLDGGSAGKILFESEGLSGYSAEGFRAWQKAAGSIAEGTGEAGTICLNDQGGNRMDVTEEMTSTLRAEAHHPPCVMESAGFCTEHSAKSRSIGFEEETSPTLRAGTVPAAVYENHAQDVRYTEMEDSSPTVTARYGTGGNNQPLVVETPKTLKIRCGKPGGGKGALIQDDLSATLGCNNDQTLFQPVASEKTGSPDPSGEEICEKPVVSAYGICSKDSNAMKSANPDSGFYEAETSRTLDGNGGNPACNQGGIAVIEGNGTRPSHKGDGYSKSDVMYTLNATEQHGVAFAEVHASLSANDGPKGPSSQMMKKPEENFVCDVAYGIGREAFNQGKNAQFSFQVQEELEPTIVSRGPAAVAHPTYSTSKNSHHTVAEKELANTLVASDYKDPPVINDTAYGFYPQMKTEGMAFSEGLSGTLVNGTNPGYQNGVVEPDYIVRRLTPVECARLQGFPDWWCNGLETEAPTQEDIDFWRDVFETADRAMGKTVKPKSDAQIAKWLKDPYSDSAAYSMWGNGISLPVAFFVLSGIVWADENL